MVRAALCTMQDPTPTSHAGVDPVAQKVIDQISVSTMDLHPVEAGPLRVLRSKSEHLHIPCDARK